MAGAPTKLTPDIQEKICNLLRVGNYVETAAACAGIGKAALYAWLRRGAREKKGLYYEFSYAVEKAQAEGEAHAVAAISKAMPTNWQAAAWRLERKFPARWGRAANQEEEQKGQLAQMMAIIHAGPAGKK
jgi:hypothetical protein